MIDSNLVSGLVGAIVGAILAAAATVAVYLIDRGRRERAAVRAVFMESTTNETFLEALLGGLAPGPISSQLFVANLPLLAARLSEEDIRTVGLAYLFAPECDRLRVLFLEGRGIDRSVVASTHRSFGQANRVLRLAAYGPPRSKSAAARS